MVEPDPDDIPPPVPEKNSMPTHAMTATINDHMQTSSHRIPGTLLNETERQKKRAEKSSGCSIQ